LLYEHDMVVVDRVFTREFRLLADIAVIAP